MPHAGGMIRFREICDAAAARGHDGFVFDRERAAGRAPPRVLFEMVGGGASASDRAPEPAARCRMNP